MHRVRLVEHPAEPTPTGAPLRLINKAEVVRRVSLTFKTLWGMIQRGDFPAPIDSGTPRPLWFEHEIDRWMRSRPRRRYGACQ